MSSVFFKSVYSLKNRVRSRIRSSWTHHQLPTWTMFKASSTSQMLFRGGYFAEVISRRLFRGCYFAEVISRRLFHWGYFVKVILPMLFRWDYFTNVISLLLFRLIFPPMNEHSHSESRGWAQYLLGRDRDQDRDLSSRHRDETETFAKLSETRPSSVRDDDDVS